MGFALSEAGITGIKSNSGAILMPLLRTRILSTLLPLGSLILVLYLPWLPQTEQRLITFPWLDRQILHRDSWWVFFGYAGCGDTCPLALVKLRDAYQRMPADSRPGVVLVDITTTANPEVLTQYVHAFHPEFRAYAPSRDELERLVRSFGVTIDPRSIEPDPYHSSAIYHLRRAEGGWMLVRTFQDRRLDSADLIEATTAPATPNR
ncbi:MAG: SCO family protein [Candidatus Competibacteraceae bacterium]|nr:SCO family protein [Candidatus Competibacteraceae bacterium]